MDETDIPRRAPRARSSPAVIRRWRLDAQVALTLRTLGGLTTTEIARAFLVPEATMAQRLVRAKRKIKAAASRSACRPTHLLPDRLAAVLAVVYLIFNEGYGGARRARRRGDPPRARAGQLMPDEPEAHGLLALMLLHDARRDARFRDGELVLLADQDRALWDRGADRRGPRGARARARPAAAAGRTCCRPRSPRCTPPSRPTGRRSPPCTASSPRLTGSPVVELNRAVAVAEAGGPEAGLESIDRARARRLPVLPRGPRRLSAPPRPHGRGSPRLRAGARARARRAGAAVPRAPAC